LVFKVHNCATYIELCIKRPGSLIGSGLNITRLSVQPQLRSDKRATRILGYISEISIYEINVPFEFRDVFESAPQMGENYRPKSLPYDVTVNFGMRLEPWITTAARK
jgi:hypothetical protein